MRLSKIIAIVIVSFLLLSLSGCVNGDKGSRLIKARCTSCHSTKRIYAHKRDKTEWLDIIKRMERHGAVLNSNERAFLVDYLSSKD